MSEKPSFHVFDLLFVFNFFRLKSKSSPCYSILDISRSPQCVYKDTGAQGAKPLAHSEGARKWPGLSFDPTAPAHPPWKSRRSWQNSELWPPLQQAAPAVSRVWGAGVIVILHRVPHQTATFSIFQASPLMFPLRLQRCFQSVCQDAGPAPHKVTQEPET